MQIAKQAVSILGSFLDLNAYITSAGSNYKTIAFNKSFSLSGAVVTIPATIDITRLNDGVLIDNGVLNINRMTANPNHKWVGDNLSATFLGVNPTNSFAKIEWFGSGPAAKAKMVAAFPSTEILFYDTENNNKLTLKKIDNTFYVVEEGISGFSGYSGFSGIRGDSYTTTSTDSMDLSVTPQTFQVEIGLAWATAQPILITHDINNAMVGHVRSYDRNTGIMVVDVDTVMDIILGQFL